MAVLPLPVSRTDCGAAGLVSVVGVPRFARKIAGVRLTPARVRLVTNALCWTSRRAGHTLTHARKNRPMKLHNVGRLPPVVREFGLGVVFWFAFLLVLEPGNLLRAIRAGSSPSWSQETFRIVLASLLGACSAPLLFALVRRFPVEGNGRWRHSAILVASAGLLSAALIL